jgi:hypothetical protein
MSDSTNNPNTSNENPTDGSAVFTHPETPYLKVNLTYLDRLVLHQMMSEGKRFVTLTEKEVTNFFV